MNRPIKFRAWDGEMFHYFTALSGLYGVVTLEPQQFTGLHDRNGREIYEGDIVKCSRGCPHVIEFMNEVPSTNIGGMPGFYLSGLNEGYAWTGKEEVIGNLYQTPELIP